MIILIVAYGFRSPGDLNEQQASTSHSNLNNNGPTFNHRTHQTRYLKG